MKGFDRVAFCYDFLARLVFGNAIVSAQEYYLREIKDGDHVLILGGGTGWILDSILRESNPGEIWYIDSSPKMIDRSKARTKNPERIHFITGTTDQIPGHISFDVIITNFFLDMFNDDRLPGIISEIVKCASPDGVWLCSDFINTGKSSHKILLKMMFLFFRLTADLENNQLPDWESTLIRGGVYKAKEKHFFNGFIRSIVFLKT